MREATALCSGVTGRGVPLDALLRYALQLPFDKLRAGLRMLAGVRGGDEAEVSE